MEVRRIMLAHRDHELWGQVEADDAASRQGGPGRGSGNAASAMLFIPPVMMKWTWEPSISGNSW